ncbi:MAG: apolipoprotein N-acyltransferase [Polyangiaceae bacterium]
MSTRVRFALAALSGVITFASFPGVGAWPLAFVAWVPLLLALEGQTMRRAAWLGFVAGLFATAPALRFLIGTLQEQSGLPTIACVAIFLLVAAYHALRGLVIGAVSRAVPMDPGPPSLLFAAGLALSEIALPSLFPWYFGASVHAIPLFVQPAELGGPVLVSVILAMSSVGVAETISSWGPNRQTKPRVIVPAFAIPIVAALWGSLRISQIDARVRSAPSLVAGVVQTNLARDDETEAIRRLREGTAKLAAKGATLVVWPEGALPWAVPFPLVESAFGMIGAPKVNVITGALVQGEGAPPPAGEKVPVRHDDASRRVTNSALLFESDRWTGRYDKMRLLPFSESLPFEETLPWLRDLSPRSGRFAAGKSLAPLRLGEHGIATFICYEDLFPGHVSALGAAGDVDLLVNVTNDSWFGSVEPEMHLALAKMRAVEQRKYLLRSTVTGVSAIIDPVGRALATIPQDHEDAASAEIRWMRGRTLYAFTGDAPWWLFVIGTVAISVVRHRRSKRAA